MKKCKSGGGNKDQNYQNENPVEHQNDKDEKPAEDKSEEKQE